MFMEIKRVTLQAHSTLHHEQHHGSISSRPAVVEVGFVVDCRGGENGGKPCVSRGSECGLQLKAWDRDTVSVAGLHRGYLSIRRCT